MLVWGYVALIALITTPVAIALGAAIVEEWRAGRVFCAVVETALLASALASFLWFTVLFAFV